MFSVSSPFVIVQHPDALHAVVADMLDGPPLVELSQRRKNVVLQLFWHEGVLVRKVVFEIVDDS